MTREIGLVSCVKSKRDSAAEPKDLYTSTYFERMRTYAEHHYDEWVILSAKYGLLDPEGPPVKPYDETLNDATEDQRKSWAEQVIESLDERGFLAEDTILVIHAGKAYYEEILPLLAELPVNVEIPTEGLRFGETLAWYGERV